MTAAQLPTVAHTATAEAIAAAPDVRADVGLGHPQTAERLVKWGPNALPVTPPRSPWRVLLAQFKSVMIVSSAWIRSGIATGQQVIAYPPATVRDGLRVAARKP